MDEAYTSCSGKFTVYGGICTRMCMCMGREGASGKRKEGGWAADKRVIGKGRDTSRQKDCMHRESKVSKGLLKKGSNGVHIFSRSVSFILSTLH